MYEGSAKEVLRSREAPKQPKAAGPLRFAPGCSLGRAPNTFANAALASEGNAYEVFGEGKSGVIYLV